VKSKILALFGAFVLASSLSAYEQKGDISLKWTGFKLAEKVGVSGTFLDVKSSSKPSDSFSEFLKSAVVSIDTASLESNDKGRNENIITTLFAQESAKSIKAEVLSVDENDNSLVAKITMNSVSKNIIMSYDKADGSVVAKGSINILDFDLQNPFLAFAKKCEGFHEGKSYSQVDIEFTLAFKE